MKVAVSGNRKGLTKDSRKVILKYLAQHQISQIHHGDCIGIDADIHTLCLQQQIKVVIHPPRGGKSRANCQPKQFDQVRLEQQFLKRNKQIVNECDVLIAFPPAIKQFLRSGTWSKIRYARKANKQVIIVFEDGSVQQAENKSKGKKSIKQKGLVFKK